jgi:WG containing repeat/Caspase domain
MKKLYLLIGLSISYNALSGQDLQALPWRIPPSPEYKTVEAFSEGYAVVQKAVVTKEGNKNIKTNRFFYLDLQGNLSQDHYQAAYSFCNGLASVQNDDDIWKFRKWKASKKGESIFMSGDYDVANNFQNGYAPVKKDGNWGFIKPDGTYLIRPIYEGDGARYFSNNWAAVQKNGKILIVNTSGEEKYLLKKYTYVSTFSESLAVVQDEKGNWGYIDTLGEEKIPIRKGRQYAGPFSEGFAAVSEGGGHLAFLNAEGKIVFEFKNGTDKKEDIITKNLYDLHPFSNGLAAVKQGKWGFIDTTGKVVIPCEYDAVTRFSEGFAAVQKDKQWFYINTKNGIIRQGGDNSFQAAKPCTEGIAWVKTKEGWGALSMTEKLEIVWTLPFKNKVLTESMTLTAQLSSSRALQDFELSCNGQVLKKSRFFQNNLLETTWSEPIVLKKGRNVLKLTVRNKQQEESNECVLYYQPPTPQQVQYSAIMIANSSYEHWGDLYPQPLQDADTLAMILQQHYQFQRIFTLRDATLAQMNSIFRDLTQQTDETERILIFYAGHGHQPEMPQNVAYLVPKDALNFKKRETLESQEAATLFSSAIFAGYIQKMSSKHILTMIDACFGGSFILDAPPIDSRGRGGRGAVTGQKPAPKPTPVSPNASVFVSCTEEAASEKLTCREVMSSGQRVTVSNESDFIQAVFFTLLRNKECKLSSRTLFERLKDPMEQSLQRRIKEASSKMQEAEEKQALKERTELVPQIGILPNSGSAGGDFIFRRKI